MVFYVKYDSIYFQCRKPKRIKNAYKGKPIDFLKRAIPKNIYDSSFDNTEQIIVNYLLKRDTTTKKLLLKKAIIDLYPNRIFGKEFWRGKL